MSGHLCNSEFHPHPLQIERWTCQPHTSIGSSLQPLARGSGSILSLVDHSIYPELWVYVKLRRTGQHALSIHCIHVKGSLYSEDEGNCIHDDLTCVWNTVQVTATSSPPIFSVRVALQKPYCCPQKEKSYLNWFKEWILSPSFTDTPSRRKKTSILNSLKKFFP